MELNMYIVTLIKKEGNPESVGCYTRKEALWHIHNFLEMVRLDGEGKVFYTKDNGKVIEVDYYNFEGRL
jgi:hypothetical protein